MTKAEMIKMVKAIVEQFEDDGVTTKRFGEETVSGNIGIRFEDKVRTVGEVIEDRSRSNINREEERDFPEYGTKEYFEMDELNGVCAYNAYGTEWHPYHENNVENASIIGCHCYVIWAYNVENGEDDGEIIMEDAEVLAVIY